MSAKEISNDVKSLNEESQAAWNQNAAWWDETIGPEGNTSHRLLIAPAVERLLQAQPGERILDCACGSGVFSRRLAQLGARVVGFDFSEKFLERAKARTTEHLDRIEYRRIDATDEAQLLTLGKRQFDAAVCLMALMDMPTIEPLLAALSQLLQANGRFVFAVTHPCFNTTGCQRVIEEEDQDGKIITRYAVKISRYLQPIIARGIGILGQPTPSLHFDRPLGVLLNACFRVGFVLDGLEEPGHTQPPDGARPFSWSNYPEIPPFLIARLRLKA